MSPYAQYLNTYAFGILTSGKEKVIFRLLGLTPSPTRKVLLRRLHRVPPCAMIGELVRRGLWEGPTSEEAARMSRGPVSGSKADDVVYPLYSSSASIPESVFPSALASRSA